VLDREGAFPSRCNLEMVNVERFEDEAEENMVRFLIERHVNYTDSSYAQAILNDWKKLRKRFVKIMPLDYKRVKQEQEELEATAHG
jgi:glutamate synthase (ferredoxin)